MLRFDKPFTQQEPIPDSAIDSAVRVMRSGRLHRYNTLEGESGEVERLEAEFAGYQGSRYCLACTSGGYALQVALRSLGVGAGDQVLCNGWTLAPVPGAICATGAGIVLVETTDDCTIDLDDLDVQLLAHSQDVGRMLDPAEAQLADVQHALDAAQIHERAVALYRPYLAGHDRADLQQGPGFGRLLLGRLFEALVLQDLGRDRAVLFGTHEPAQNEMPPVHFLVEATAGHSLFLHGT